MISNACDALIIFMFSIILSLSLSTLAIVIHGSYAKSADAERLTHAIERMEIAEDHQDDEIAHLWAALYELDYRVRLRDDDDASRSAGE